MSITTTLFVLIIIIMMAIVAGFIDALVMEKQ